MTERARSAKHARRRLGYHYDTWCSICKISQGKLAVANGGGDANYKCTECQIKKSTERHDYERIREARIQEEAKRLAEERNRIATAREAYLRERPPTFTWDKFKPLLMALTAAAYPTVYTYIDIEAMCDDVHRVIVNGIENSRVPEGVAESITRTWYSVSGYYIPILDYLKVCGYPCDDPFPSVAHIIQ